LKRNIFKTANDVHKSDLWEKISGSKPRENSRIFLSSRLENIIYQDLRKNVDNGLNEIESLGQEKLNTFSSLLQDTFQAIYSIKPKRADEDKLVSNARFFNKEIIDHLLLSNEYPAFKAICEGRDLPAYEAVKEFAKQIFDKLDELLNAANRAKDNEAKKLLDLLNKLERQQEGLIEQINEKLEQYKNGNLSQEAEKALLKAANNAISKQKQIDNLSTMIAQNIRLSKESFQAAVSSAVSSAKEKAEQAESIISSWGLEGSNPETIKHNTELVRRVQGNDKIRSIAKYLGKYREILDNARKNSYAFGRGDKYDIELGNDYTRAVSSEYAYLAMPETIPLFIQKVQRKGLKQYRKREHIAKGHGDVVICLDESGSTKGEPIAWGKALALTLMEAANRNGQNCAIIRFSGIGEVQPHYFLQNQFTAEDILAFADSFYGGGTEFKGPLLKAVEIIESNGFRNADLLFLTDGDCSIDKKFTDDFKEKRTALNFSVNGIVLDKGTHGSTLSMNDICDRVYRLSEMTKDDLSEELIKRAA